MLLRHTPQPHTSTIMQLRHAPQLQTSVIMQLRHTPQPHTSTIMQLRHAPLQTSVIMQLALVTRSIITEACSYGLCLYTP